MASEIYKTHPIVSRSHYDTASQAWKAEILISLGNAPAGQDHWHVLKTDLSFETENEAVDWGLEQARRWIDQRL